MDSWDDRSGFDSIIAQIRNTGHFQKRFNFVFNFGLVITVAMSYMNIVLSVATPDHWCHVPGREDTNYTLLEWKTMTIPMEVDAKGVLSYSKCKRFTTVNAALYNPENSVIYTEDVAMLKCDHGWDYDRTWYEQTASTQNDWVCDDAMVPANALAIGRIGEVIGTLCFGHLADNVGRMPVYLITSVTLVLGRVCSTFTSSWVYVFYFFSIFGSLSLMMVIQSPQVIGLEISRGEDRALVCTIMCYGWILGATIMPLIMWWLRDWVPFLLATTLPCAVFLLFKRWMIESPRWLVSKGKIKRCVRELAKVAKANDAQLPGNVEWLLGQSQAGHGKSNHYTGVALFSSARLAKNTVVLASLWTILMMIYFSLIVNVSNLGGNPFLNYLLQALGQMPACYIAKYISDRHGRRCATLLCFLLTFCGCFPILFLVNDSENFIIISGICIFLKFSVSLGLYSVNLQSAEIYPTCIRQTGMAINVLTSCIFGVVSPYIISLGVTVNAMLPYIIYCILSLIAAICCIFLPETLRQHLPESLEDAATFGADQDFWGRKKRCKDQFQDEAEIPLSQLLV